MGPSPSKCLFSKADGKMKFGHRLVLWMNFPTVARKRLTVPKMAAVPVTIYMKAAV